MQLFSWIKKLFGSSKLTEYTTDYTKPNAFEHTWSLLDFARKYGPKMEISKSPDFNNRASLWRCRFTNKDGKQTYAVIASSIDETSVSYIQENKTKLRIGQLPNGRFVLYDNGFKDWQDVYL